MFFKLGNLLKNEKLFKSNLIHTRNIVNQRNHYDVLNVKKDSSSKEIRAAYIKLSKMLHPDRNKTKDASQEFIRLSEAYRILSDPDSRRHYDLFLTSDRPTYEYYGIQTNKPRNPIRHGPYYGIKGINKLPNFWIVMFCLIFTSIGVGLQILAIRRSFTFQRQVLDEQSEANGITLAAVRARAREQGNEAQLERLRQKVEAEQAAYANYKSTR